MNPLTVIIPTKTPANLRLCEAAILEHEPDFYSHRDLIVVDDLGSLGLHAFKRIDGIKPFNFARNVNLGIEAVWGLPLAPPTHDVLILNDDALLTTPNGFTLMHEAIYKHPEFGVVSAACADVGNPNMAPQKHVFADQWWIREEPRMVCFVAVLIPASTLERVGWLDQRFTGYGCEDDDYCLRVRRAGLKIGIFDNCVVDHSTLKSTFRPDGGGADFSGNAEIFKQKWGAGHMEL